MPEPPPSRSQASEQLDLTEDARRAAVLASRRPAWQDALAAALIGIAWTGFFSWTVPGAVVAVVASVLCGVLALRSRRRTGRLTDDRGVLAHGGFFTIAYVTMVLVGQVLRDPGRSAWWYVAVFALVTPAVFAYLRLQEAYEVRRLTRGDYGPYDRT
ncbi:hypothetical protein [Propioniciclava soli]|uniref:Integral membrane protein n=1 Tax=Propioniciclava soli TaxID=2775081 RepID=A0ABZ3C5E9_9ACTN|nr:hypothetical protein [Propioniciclava soli]